MSLQQILSGTPEDHGGVFHLSQRKPMKHIPWYLQYHWMAVMCLVVLGIFYFHAHNFVQTLCKTWSGLLHITIHLPLQEYYRNAPAIMGGWEGQSLPAICARITFHGDELFWRRNLEECERIFTFKEEAFMRLAKPAVYVVLLTTSVWVIRMLVREHARHRRPLQNRDMVETYHAIQILLRQFKRHCD